MHYAATTIGVAVLAVIFVVLWRRYRARKGQRGGFREWITNPEYREFAELYFQQQQELTIPDDLSEADIRAMVERLFVQEDEDFNFDRLKLVGERAVPFLLEALSDSRTRILRFEGGHCMTAKSPFERICELLEPFSPVEAIAGLTEFSQSPDEYFRKYAARALGSIGDTATIAPMLRLLSDNDGYVRNNAIRGIGRAVAAERCSREFHDAMFPALANLLNRRDETVMGEAPKVLLGIDREGALEAMLSPKYFTTDNCEVRSILKAINELDIPVPHEKLLPFLKAVKPLAAEFPHDREYAEALRAYAINPDASTENLFRDESTSEIERVREAAIESLAKLHGVGDPTQVVFAAVEEQGLENLPLPQQYYYAVFMYDAEVCNGGHAQFFSNSAGDYWRIAWNALRTIGGPERAGILRAATQLFGKVEPSEDRFERQSQLEKVYRKHEKSLSDLDSQYYRSTEEKPLNLLMQYALANPGAFKAKH